MARRKCNEFTVGSSFCSLPQLDYLSHVLEFLSGPSLLGVFDSPQDPADPETILHEVNKRGLTLASVLTTHHHWDHAGGNEALKKALPQLPIYGGDKRIPALTRMVKDNDILEVLDFVIRVIYAPCHTSGHVLYFLDDGANNLSAPLLFSGDTLFIGGCGKFFEGSGEDMDVALNHKINALSPNTQIYCGHEYTASNLRFGLSMEPNNEAIKSKLQWAVEQRRNNLSTIPSTLKEEKEHNVFLRLHSPEIRRRLGLDTDAKSATVMNALRQKKDKWKE